MKELNNLEKKEQLKVAKMLKPKTHFALEEILVLLEFYRINSKKIEMEKAEFLSLINSHFKFDDKQLLDRIFQVFDEYKVPRHSIPFQSIPTDHEPCVSICLLQDGMISQEEWIIGMNVFLLGERNAAVWGSSEISDVLLSI